MLSFVAVVLALLIIAFILWWLLLETEGVYLGRRIVIWLYDVYAQRYDSIKRFQPEYEHWLLAQPIMGMIAPLENPLVLDVATGTGRLPLALLDHPHFQGRIVAVDLSRRMLAQAAQKLKNGGARVSLLWGPAEDLPFADNTFDVVTCLESLEFMTSRVTVLKELARVLRPGGTLLITNRTGTRWMPGKLWTTDQLTALLTTYCITDVDVELWQEDYHKVWGMKDGDSPATGARPLAEILRCPRCRDHLMIERQGEWICTHCTAWMRVGEDGVIELFPLYHPNE